MKKNIFAILFVFLLVPMMAQAVQYAGYEDVVPANNYSYSPATGISATDAVTNELNRVNRQLAQAKKERAEMTLKQDVTNRSLAGALHLGAETFKDVQEVKATTKSNAEAIKIVDGALNSMGRQHFYGVVIMIVIGLLVGGIIIALIARSRRNVDLRVSQVGDEVNCRANEILAAVREVQASVNAVPEAVHAYFNPAPLDVVVAGHRVILNQPTEVISRKAYQILRVEDNIDASVTPATFALNEISDRNRAIDSLKRTMRDHFSGKLADLAKAGSASAKLTEELIKHLQTTKQLAITKL